MTKSEKKIAANGGTRKLYTTKNKIEIKKKQQQQQQHLTSSVGAPKDFNTAPPNGNVNNRFSSGRMGTIATTFSVFCKRS